MPSKPVRYGRKIWALSDASTYYCGNMQVYLGKQGDTTEKEQGMRVVKDLSVYINATGINDRTDNFLQAINWVSTCCRTT